MCLPPYLDSGLPVQQGIRVVVVVVVTGGLRHKMEVQDDHIVEEVDKLREHYRQVHSSIGLYIPSWT